MATINDRKAQFDTDSDDVADYYEAAVMTATDYFPFGAPMRQYQASGYRYGFNGKETEHDGEFAATVHYDYGFRVYHPAVGRFLSVDPLMRSYPELTPYQFAGNTPIQAIDLDGLEPLVATDYRTLSQLKRKLKLDYCYEVVNHEDINQVTVSQTYKTIFLKHILTANGTKQSELETFWGMAAYAVTHPVNANMLNKINKISYRKKNKQGMAIADMPKQLILHLAEGEKRGTLDNTLLHVTGQALITTLFGQEYADLSGDIHERDHVNLITGTLREDDAAAIDNYVDIINNKWGQRWGEAIANDLGITKETKWTSELTANYLNALQGKLSRTMGLRFNETFSEDDDFIKEYTIFINENK